MSPIARALRLAVVALLLVPAALRAQEPDEDPGADPAASAQENRQAAEKDAKDARVVQERSEDAEIASPAETGGKVPDVFSAPGDELRVVPDSPKARATRGWGPGVARFAGSLWLAVPACVAPAPDTVARPDGAPRPACPPEMWTRTPELTLRALDLVSVEWGHRVPGREIRVAFGEPRRGIRTGGAPGTGAPLDWSAAVPLRGVRAGTYHGFLLFTRETDPGTVRPPAALPVTLEVRDSPLPALAILAAGFLLLMRLRAYRDGNLRRHTHLLAIAEAKARIEKDDTLAAGDGIAVPFWTRFKSLLNGAIAQSEERNPPESLPQLEAVNALILRWRTGKPEWLTGLRADHAGIARLKPHSTTHAKALFALLRKAYEDAPDVGAGGTDVDDAATEEALASGPDSSGRGATRYRRAAEDRAAMVDRYFAFHGWLAEIRTEAGSVVDADARKKLIGAVERAGVTWDNLPEPQNAVETEKTLRGDVDAARVKAGTLQAPPPTDADESISSGAESASLKKEEPDEPEDALVPRSFAVLSDKARRARRNYATTLAILVYLTTVLFGLNETWGDNPVFGASWLADYTEVIAWTLGANVASLATAAAFAGQWSLPWLSRLVSSAPTSGGGGALGG